MTSESRLLWEHSFSKSIDELDEGCFASAMYKLIRLMFETYPKAEIIIFIEDSITDEG